MIQGFFLRYLHLILNTDQAWKRMASIWKEDQPKQYFAIPSIICVALVHFLYYFFSNDYQWLMALRLSVGEIIVLHLTIYVAGACAHLLAKFLLHQAMDMQEAIHFIIYCLAPVFFIEMINPIVNQYFYADIFKTYTLYIAYVGAYRLWNLQGPAQTQFALSTGITTIMMPSIIRLIIGYVIPGLVQ